MRSRRLKVTVVALVTGLVVLLTAIPSQAATGDPLSDLQWALRTIGADPGGQATGAGVTVAVIDTGVQADHEDLAGAVVASVDCIGAAGDPARCRPASGDDDGHGTHVAGIVGARARNGKGIAGVAPRVTLQSVRVLSRGCEDKGVGGVVCGAVGDSTDVEAAIRWAVANGADVINLSVADDAVARAATGSPLGRVIEEAWGAGVIVVVAAGNELDVAMGRGYEDVPAIVVAATDPNDDKATYSNSAGSARWGMAAPGGAANGACPSQAVLSTWVRSQAPNEDYACMDGTSMAAPHVAGAAALLLAAGFTAPQAVEQLLRTAVDLGEEGPDPVYGAGRLDLAAALNAPRPADLGTAATPPPSDSATTTAAATGPVSSPSEVSPETPAGTPDERAEPPAAAPVARPARPGVGRLELPGGPDGAAALPIWLVVVAATAMLADAAGLAIARRRRAAEAPRAVTPR